MYIIEVHNIDKRLIVKGWGLADGFWQGSEDGLWLGLTMAPGQAKRKASGSAWQMAAD